MMQMGRPAPQHSPLPKPEYRVIPCPTCTRPVIQARNTSGRPTLVNAKPTPDGTVSLYPNPTPGQPPQARVIGTARRFGRNDLRVSHSQGCGAYRRPAHRSAS